MQYIHVTNLSRLDCENLGKKIDFLSIIHLYNYNRIRCSEICCILSKQFFYYQKTNLFTILNSFHAAFQQNEICYCPQCVPQNYYMQPEDAEQMIPMQQMMPMQMMPTPPMGGPRPDVLPPQYLPVVDLSQPPYCPPPPVPVDEIVTPTLPPPPRYKDRCRPPADVHYSR
jgi:hypothetical protein